MDDVQRLAAGIVAQMDREPVVEMSDAQIEAAARIFGADLTSGEEYYPAAVA